MRRSLKTVESEQNAISCLQIDDEKYKAELNGNLLDLTAVEFRLLKTLADVPAKVFSRDQLMECIYNDRRIVTDRTVDTHIKNLRKKTALHSLYGVG